MKCCYFIFIYVLFFSSCSTYKKADFDISDQKIAQKFDLSQSIIDKFKDEKIQKKPSFEESAPLEQKTSNSTDLIKSSDIKVRPKEKKKKIEKSKNESEQSQRIKNKNAAVVAPLVKIIQSSSDQSVAPESVKKNDDNMAWDEEDGVHKQPDLTEYPEEFVKYDEISKPVFDLYTPGLHEDEKFVFEVSYLGITAGYITLKNNGIKKIADKEVYHLSARMISAKYYNMIYRLDDILHSFVVRESFLPIKHMLNQNESGKVIDDLQLFDHDAKKTFTFYKKIKDSKVTQKKVDVFIPTYFQDSFSGLYFMRTLPLDKIGIEYNYPIVTRGKIWILKSRVDAFETIEVMGKKYPAIRIKAETQFPGVLSKRGDIVFWYSNDERKLLLKFSAKIKIGSVSGEVIEYKAGGKKI